MWSQASSFSSIWEHDRTGNLWVPHLATDSEALQVICFNKSLRWFWCLLKFENHSTKWNYLHFMYLKSMLISIYLWSLVCWKIFVFPLLVIPRMWLKTILLSFRFETKVGFLLYLLLQKASVYSMIQNCWLCFWVPLFFSKSPVTLMLGESELEILLKKKKKFIKQIKYHLLCPW